MEGKGEGANRTGRENQGEGCRRHLRPFLASLLFCMLSSTVHTIASRSPLRHHRTSSKDERKDGHPVRFWAMPSPHLATTSPPIDQQPATTGQRIDVLPSCPPRARPLPILQVVRVGHRASQGGRSPPAHPADPLHPAGVCLGIRLLSSSYHLTINAIPGRWSVFFKRGKALKYFFSAYQIISRKTRSWYQI